MANLKSSKKDIRRIAKRTLINKTYRDNMKSSIKGLRLSISKQKVEDSEVFTTQKAIDKAAKKGIIKKQTASRLKSRLMKATNKIK